MNLGGGVIYVVIDLPPSLAKCNESLNLWTLDESRDSGLY